MHVVRHIQNKSKRISKKVRSRSKLPKILLNSEMFHVGLCIIQVQKIPHILYTLWSPLKKY